MTETTEELVRAKQSFRANGTLVRAGDIYGAGDPVVTGREQLFGPVAGAVRATVPGGVPVPPPFLDPVERPKGNASTDEWAAYVLALASDADVEGKSRDELQALADELEGGGD